LKDQAGRRIESAREKRQKVSGVIIGHEWKSELNKNRAEKSLRGAKSRPLLEMNFRGLRGEKWREQNHQLQKRKQLANSWASEPSENIKF
jgi:hypothetical protein